VTEIGFDNTSIVLQTAFIMLSFKSFVLVAALCAQVSFCTAAADSPVNAAGVQSEGADPLGNVNLASVARMEGGLEERDEKFGAELGNVERAGYNVKYCPYRKCEYKDYCYNKPYTYCYNHCYCVRRPVYKNSSRLQVDTEKEAVTSMDTAAHSYDSCGYGSYRVCTKKCEVRYKQVCEKKKFCYTAYRPCRY
jgi:hypothetical protein